MSKSRLKTAQVTFRGDEAFSVRQITHGERIAFIERSEKEPRSVGAYLVAACTLNTDGEKLFPDEAAVNEEPSDLIDLLSREILRLSGIEIDTPEQKQGEPKKA